MPTSFRAHMKSPTPWLIALACYWCFLFVGTHAPAGAVGLPERGSDKLVHAVAFAILAALLATTCRLMAGRLTFRHVASIWVVVMLYAAIDEWTQEYVGRQANVWDWTADSLGAALGLMLLVWFRRSSRRWSVKSNSADAP